jgi:uncharacterized membrane protein YjgN (DUF898 family)
MPLAVSLSSGLIAPIASQMAMNYLGNNTRYGNLRFETHTPLGPLYANLGWTFLFSLAAFAILGFAAFGVFAASGSGLTELFAGLGAEGQLGETLATIGIVGAVIAIYSVFIFAYIFYSAGVRNVAYNYTILDGVHRFKSTLSRLRYVWIIFSNFFAVIFTVGLLRPWAAIRSWSYLVSNTALIQAGNMPISKNVIDPSGNAATAEYLDIDGIDFGL